MVVELACEEQPALKGPVRPTVVEVETVEAKVEDVDVELLVTPVGDVEPTVGIVVDDEVVLEVPDDAVVGRVDPAMLVEVEVSEEDVDEADPPEAVDVEVESALDGIETPTDDPVNDIACCKGPGSAPDAAATPVPVTNIADAPAISVLVLIALPNISYIFLSEKLVTSSSPRTQLQSESECTKPRLHIGFSIGNQSQRFRIILTDNALQMNPTTNHYNRPH